MYKRSNRLYVVALILATAVSCCSIIGHPVLFDKITDWKGESGICKGYQTGVEKHRQKQYAEAFKIWHPLAEAGCPRAQASLGTLYETGRGVSLDSDLALKWYLRAAEQKEPDAYYYLGWHYITEGKDHNPEKAKFWFEKAANSDSMRVRGKSNEMLRDFWY